ncbi:MAG: hypothetical protein CL607_15075 [Anaerolineaceae bacterium]|nr:hypothetical protein [Anaerolineaceae bacterium]
MIPRDAWQAASTLEDIDLEATPDAGEALSALPAVVLAADDTPSAENGAQSDSEAENAAAEAPVRDAWYYFAKLPRAVIDELDVALLGMLAKIMRHLPWKRNLLACNYEELAEMTGVPVSSVRRYTKALAKAGHLHITTGGGRSKANTYRLAGRLAVEIYGVDATADMARDTAVEAPEQASTEAQDGAKKRVSDEPKPVQNEHVYKEEQQESPEYLSKLNTNDAKGAQNEQVKGAKPVQIEQANTHKIKRLDSKEPDIDINTNARARVGTSGDDEKVYYPKGDENASTTVDCEQLEKQAQIIVRAGLFDAVKAFYFPRLTKTELETLDLTKDARGRINKTVKALMAFTPAPYISELRAFWGWWGDNYRGRDGLPLELKDSTKFAEYFSEFRAMQATKLADDRVIKLPLGPDRHNEPQRQTMPKSPFAHLYN